MRDATRDAGPEWSGERVRRWLAQADALDRQAAPISELLFADAGLQPGERVLDVGCGSGPTTRRAARLVGPTGEVIGLDVSRAMLDAAAATPAEPAAAPIRWVEADVARWEPDTDPVDAVISRFGVMFFDDPGAAFAALGAATRPGGRLCAMTWDRRDRSPLFQIPLGVVTQSLRGLDLEPEEPPLDGGAFSLHDPDVVGPLLEGAGWSDVRLEPIGVELRVGGGLAPEPAADAVLGIGPSRILTAGLDPERLDPVREAVAAELAGHVDGSGHVVLGGSVVRITARRA